MKLEVLRGGIKHFDPVDDVQMLFEEGDVVEVRNVLAVYFIQHGWARAVNGELPTQPQVPGEHAIGPYTRRQIGLQRPSLVVQLIRKVFGSKAA